MSGDYDFILAEACAIRDRNAIEGRECAVCPTGVTEEGEELCPDCEAESTADINHEVKELLYA